MRTRPYISVEEEVFEMKQNLCDFLSCLLIRESLVERGLCTKRSVHKLEC